ncbi:uncharacterized protein LOC127853082 isoform X2 [Dreissena polymorpha]|uniref:Uncharacterized protein n=2 Tax=Dreissena polymorpha TaxID=45954 RepID=A0A9D4CT93_DREPO|nr:uncharacterized protein LOC127853082 isoform X2 [Dreissena polymorpha]KAH3729786.1 hypothetical protein DPMN_055764 [Dreissena polymorpha]
MTRLRIIVCSIFCVWSFVDVNAFLLEDPSPICRTNQDADPLINGDSQNAVRNFLRAINDKGFFAVRGDTQHTTGGCRREIGDKKHRRLYHNRMLTLDCWEPSECTMVEDGEFFQLIPTTSLNRMPVRSRTVPLPLDEHETASYTFLPMVSRHNILFVTAMLSG